MPKVDNAQSLPANSNYAAKKGTLRSALAISPRKHSAKIERGRAQDVIDACGVLMRELIMRRRARKCRAEIEPALERIPATEAGPFQGLTQLGNGAVALRARTMRSRMPESTAQDR
jgi:hypothetical protein